MSDLPQRTPQVTPQGGRPVYLLVRVVTSANKSQARRLAARLLRRLHVIMGADTAMWGLPESMGAQIAGDPTAVRIEPADQS